MKIELFIEALNQYKDLINPDNKSFFAIQKTIEPNPSFPLYKMFKIVLNQIIDNEVCEILTISNSERIPNQRDEENAWNKLYIEFMMKILTKLDKYVSV